MTDELNSLREWRLDSEVPEDFNAGVWRRLESRASADPAAALKAWLQELFARRAFAVAYTAFALLFGLVLGQLQGSRAAQNKEAALQAQYVQSIDPYSLAGTR